MRRFTLGDRYWTIHQTNANACEIKFGTTGGPERAVTRTIANADAIDEMIAKQLAQGYVEVTPVAAVTASIEPKRRWTRRYVDDNDRRVTISIDGKHVIQRFDDDTPQVSKQDSAAEAKQLVERMIDTYYGMGFLLIEGELVDEVAVPTLAFAPNLELEAACRASPDDDAAWAVYRDWLVGRGDLRGEYTALIAGGSAEAARALLETHRDAFAGTFDEVRVTRSRHGFPFALEIKKADPDGGNDLDEIVRDVLPRPLYLFVESLRFGLAAFSYANNWRPTAEAVCDSPIAPQLRELRFDDFDDKDSELSWIKFGDFSPLWSRLPKLETLVIKSGAGGVLGDIDLPELRRFERISGGLTRAELLSITNARWPKLEHLSIWTGSWNYGASSLPADLVPLFAGDRVPALRHLGIVNSELVDSVLELLVGSALLPRLHSLDVSKGVLADASFLVANAAAFRHLDVIDVGENLLSPDEVARIHNALPQARVGQQRDMYAPDADGNDARYVAVSE
ncbi:MAG TPA: hypothetical protein VGG28_09810 [Kofleriaceae bacterium]